MFRIPLHRPLLVLALGLTLASTASGASSPSSGFLAEEGRGFLQFLQSFLLETTHPKAGCTIDPHGQPRCFPGGITPKHGCTIDPNGQPQCSSAMTPKHGCTIDPSGQTSCTP